MIDRNFIRINRCLARNEEGLSEKLEELEYKRRGDSRADGIIVYPETNEYEELPYSEIEFKEGWHDWYDETDAFLREASEEYYNPKFRPGLSRFSVVSVYWTDIYYSEDPDDWSEDLKEHLNPEWLGEGCFFSMMMNPGEEFIGFGLECNSLEELEILSEYFFKNGFVRQLRGIGHFEDTKKSRVWYVPSSDGPVLESPKVDFISEVNLYLYDIRYTDYQKLRKALLGLWEIGFLFKYANGYFY